MAVTNGWGQAAKNNTNGFGKLATNNIGAGSIYEDSWAGDTALIGVTADFSYSKSSYVNDEADPTPTITGTTGGTFSAGSGLVFVDSGSNTGSSTGQIDLSATTVAAYTITYTVSGVSSNVSLSVTQAFVNDYSMLFDGTNDYIIITDPYVFDNTGYTISFWYYTPAAASMMAFAQGPTSNFEIYAWATGYWYFNAAGGGGVFSPLPPIITNDWTLFTLVVSNVGATLYQNSTTGGSTTHTQTFASTPVYPNLTLYPHMFIGKRSIADTYYWNGKLDEYAIWSSELGSTEVTEIYNSGTPTALDTDAGNYTSSADLQAWYRMGD